MPPHKITRKDLKQDSFVDSIGRGVEWLQENYLKLGLGILAIVVMIVGISLYNQGQTKSRHSSSYLLYQGQSLLSRGSYSPARQRLQECIDRFGGTVAGKHARLDLAHALIALGENEAALLTLEDGLRIVGKAEQLHHNLLVFKATTLANLERYAEASDIYRDLLDAGPGDGERLELTMRLADCLRSTGRVQESIEVLEALQKDIERGDINVPSRDLESRLLMYRALAGS